MKQINRNDARVSFERERERGGRQVSEILVENARACPIARPTGLGAQMAGDFSDCIVFPRSEFLVCHFKSKFHTGAPRFHALFYRNFVRNIPK